jgi:tRNA(His) guanylyltransferase
MAEPALSHTKELANRMRQYESDFEDSIAAETPVILRCDGHSFSRIASCFQKPFDPRYHNAMVETAKDLLKDFPSATIAYTASDEITLVFPKGLNVYNNRIQKISTIAAGLASVRFYVHMVKQIEDIKVDENGKELKLVKDYGLEMISHAHFDGRVYAVPDIDEAVNCLVWRCRGDAMRNAVNAFARMHFNNRKLHKKNTGEVRDMLRRKGVPFERNVPAWAAEGTLVKREMVEIEGLNPKTGLTEKALRTRFRAIDRGITRLDSEGVDMVTSKYWTAPENQGHEMVVTENHSVDAGNENNDVMDDTIESDDISTQQNGSGLTAVPASASPGDEAG